MNNTNKQFRELKTRLDSTDYKLEPGSEVLELIKIDSRMAMAKIKDKSGAVSYITYSWFTIMPTYLDSNKWMFDNQKRMAEAGAAKSNKAGGKQTTTATKPTKPTNNTKQQKPAVKSDSKQGTLF